MSLQTFLIPLKNVPQAFKITLGVKEYNLTCRWNDSPDAGWVVDFDDATTGLPIVYNTPLVTGVDLLSGLSYLGFGGSLYVFTDGDDFATPTLLNLGVESNLYFQAEIADA